jgi:hypothetical protein
MDGLMVYGNSGSESESDGGVPTRYFREPDETDSSSEENEHIAAPKPNDSHHHGVSLISATELFSVETDTVHVRKKPVDNVVIVPTVAAQHKKSNMFIYCSAWK